MGGALFKSLAVGLLAVAIGGCGGNSAPRSKPVPSPAPPHPPAFVCHHKVPAQLGECVRQELESRGIRPAESKLGVLGRVFRPQCIDISRWQPHPEFRVLRAEGIVCVIVQGADNTHQSNPFFASQVRGAHEAGMRVGVYIFAEGGPSEAQARALIGAAAPERSRITLGAHVDAEVGSAYSHACAIASALARSFHIVGLYSSPGLWPGGRCVGIAWPAEWGGGSAYPLSGYPGSSVLFRQWCGTCRLNGNAGEIDRDEDLGLIALSKPQPKPLSLRVLYQRRHVLRGLLSRHHCRQPPWHAAKPTAYAHACHVWLAEGARANREIHAKGGR